MMSQLRSHGVVNFLSPAEGCNSFRPRSSALVPRTPVNRDSKSLDYSDERKRIHLVVVHHPQVVARTRHYHRVAVVN